MPTPSDTIEQSQTLPNVPIEVSSPFVTTQCPPEARQPPRPSPGEDHGLLDLPTPPQDLPTTNSNPMPRADDVQHPIPTSSQENPGSPDLFVRESQRIIAGIEAQPGSTEVSNGVTTHPGRRFTSSRESPGGIRPENVSLSQSLDSLRLLEAARQQESEILPEAAITRARGPSLFQSLSRRRPPIPENPQETRVISVEDGAARYVRWPATPDIPQALLEATRAQLHRSERPNSAAEAQNVEEALRTAYQRLQDHTGPQQQRSPDNSHARAADGGDSAPTGQLSIMSQTHQGDCSTPDPGVPEAQLASDPAISSHYADILAHRLRRSGRRSNADLHPRIRRPRGAASRATEPDHLAAIMPPSSTTPSIPNDGLRPQNLVLPGHKFGRYQPSSLHAGATFVGTQCSDRQEYNVKVEIKHVDMDDSFLCGHLIIEGLTQDHPKLETYFEAELIGDKYEFATRHPDWGSSEKQDMLHWNRFAAWKPLHRPYRQPETKSEANAKDFAERENIFMRWKEYFLVPDHRVTAISGASFEGFYYICFNQRRASFSGIYYHAKSERWQQLELKHVASESRGCMPAVELA